jgi:hypothetical protein
MAKERRKGQTERLVIQAREAIPDEPQAKIARMCAAFTFKENAGPAILALAFIINLAASSA